MENGMKNLIKMSKDLEGRWSVMGLWNDYLTLGREQRKLKPKDYIWATEIGMSYFDRFYKMYGIEADEEFKEHVLRKFVAGDLFEKLIGFVLATTGIMQTDNEHITIPETEKTLAVTGRPDFIAGGKPLDWEEIINDDFAKMFFRFFPFAETVAKQIVEFINDNYQEGLPPLIYEIKSINSQIFWIKKDYLQEAYHHHQLQLLTYLKAKNIQEGRVLYISKDDLTVAEFPVYLNDKSLNEEWEKDVKEMTDIYKNYKEPPQPPYVIFNPVKKFKFQKNKQTHEIQGCYTENWQIKWSNYKKKIGFESEEDYMKYIKPTLKEKNDEIKNKYIKDNKL